jgi:hypothetical protein
MLAAHDTASNSTEEYKIYTAIKPASSFPVPVLQVYQLLPVDAATHMKHRQHSAKHSERALSRTYDATSLAWQLDLLALTHTSC